ncbi:hypothetical protein [Streptomyces sp. NPDC127038]|uniref:hypothetical protein n=1 Tax=Streptomyces sp. NPDC127038 TaxID=3347114 RepID=UPI00365C5DA0
MATLEVIRESMEFWLKEDAAETVFLRIPYEPSAPWAVGVQEMDSGEFVLHEMTFGDWLLAYLRGEGVMAGASAPERPFYESLR